MNTATIPQRYLVADVIIIGFYGPLRSLFRDFVCQAPINYLTANLIALILFSLSMAICVIGARTPRYRVHWVVFGVASVLGLGLLGAVNAVSALFLLVRLFIW